MPEYPDGTLPVAIIGSVTVVGAVTVSGSVSITGTVTITGTVSITGTVTITGAVTITSGTINIQTSAGTNIIIDKLTQTAFIERRSILQNDNGVTTPTAPPNYETGTTYIGKFFPRGCRGMLDTIRVYCKRTGAGTITIAYAPQPCMGAVGSVTITPGADWDWKYATVYKMWNYDSLFLWISACSADVSHGYDSIEKPDAQMSSDSGVTWTYTNYRYYLRAHMAGETIGDVPVSGIVNVIIIPSVSVTKGKTTLSVPAKTEVLDTEQVGAGEVIIIVFYASGDTERDYLLPRIRCDGDLVLPRDVDFNSWTVFVTATTPGITLGGWSTSDHKYALIVTLAFPFKRKLEVGYYNNHASSTLQAEVSYVYKKIS